ncbi:hypothetical protein V8E54_010853 [Elaphomyces granulatus]
MTIVNAAGRAMTDVTDDQKPPGARSYLTVGLPDPHPVRFRTGIQNNQIRIRFRTGIQNIRDTCSFQTSIQNVDTGTKVDAGYKFPRNFNSIVLVTKDEFMLSTYPEVYRSATY